MFKEKPNSVGGAEGQQDFRSLAMCVAPTMAMARNQTAVIGPKKAATFAVP